MYNVVKSKMPWYEFYDPEQTKLYKFMFLLPAYKVRMQEKKLGLNDTDEFNLAHANMHGENDKQ